MKRQNVVKDVVKRVYSFSTKFNEVTTVHILNYLQPVLRNQHRFQQNKHLTFLCKLCPLILKKTV